MTPGLFLGWTGLLTTLHVKVGVLFIYLFVYLFFYLFIFGWAVFLLKKYQYHYFLVNNMAAGLFLGPKRKEFLL